MEEGERDVGWRGREGRKAKAGREEGGRMQGREER
jgi:hypothetical protein